MNWLRTQNIAANATCTEVLKESTLFTSTLKGKHNISMRSEHILSTKVFVFLYKVERFKICNKTLQHMVALAPMGKLYVNRTSGGKLDILIPLNGQLSSLKVEMGESDHAKHIIFNVGISKPGSVKKEMLSKMPNLGLLPSSHRYDGFSRAIASDRGFDERMEVLSYLTLQNNLKPYDSTIATLSTDCSKALEVDLAEALPDQIFYRTFLATPIYNTVLHSLVEAQEVNVPNELSIVCNCGSMSWRFIFKYMKSCGIPPNAATHNIMIDCCSIIRCFKSASAIVSMMVREGFYPQTMTYTALVKILLEYGDFDQALINLLDHVTAEGIQLDVTVGSEFEDFILAEDSETVLRRLQFFKDSNQNLTFTVAL
ncbi:hypothetical protein KPL71_013913 [Citrus sinensis]|uniref:Uncharacterized protein n=1 Tax=Citrus sinensis TaxID=2711 RepID=A0ACB8K843_CITSI|nr:hypothetical protein KPL71_013913 [Citrus sinensis]